jgi:hypothetical protein
MQLHLLTRFPIYFVHLLGLLGMLATQTAATPNVLERFYLSDCSPDGRVTWTKSVVAWYSNDASYQEAFYPASVADLGTLVQWANNTIEAHLDDGYNFTSTLGSETGLWKYAGTGVGYDGKSCALSFLSFLSSLTSDLKLGG